MPVRCKAQLLIVGVASHLSLGMVFTGKWFWGIGKKSMIKLLRGAAWEGVDLIWHVLIDSIKVTFCQLFIIIWLTNEEPIGKQDSYTIKPSWYRGTSAGSLECAGDPWWGAFLGVDEATYLHKARYVQLVRIPSLRHIYIYIFIVL